MRQKVNCGVRKAKWAAAGFKDTELVVWRKPDVGME